MQLLFSLIVFTHVRELIREFVEGLDELIEDLLLGIPPLQVGEELHLDVVEILLDVFSLDSLLLEGPHHLGLVACAGPPPQCHKDSLEVLVDVVSVWDVVVGCPLGSFSSRALALGNRPPSLSTSRFGILSDSSTAFGLGLLAFFLLLSPRFIFFLSSLASRLFEFFLLDNCRLDPRPQESLFSHFVVDDPLEDGIDLIVYGVDIARGLDGCKQVGVGGFVTQLSEPFLEATSCLVKGDPSVDKAGHALTLIIYWLDDFAKWGFLDGWRVVLNMVNHVALAVDSSSEGSPQALVSRAVEPDDSVDTT